jgi:4'-phosphopantetheinyl transferase
MSALPARGEVDVLSVSLDCSAERLEELRTALSADERERERRFAFDVVRNRFAAGRGLLREILAGYLGGKPHDVRFEYEQNGKPRLAGAAPPLHFNVSHREGRGLIGVATMGPIGVDIERVKSELEGREIAVKFFTHEEAQRIDAGEHGAQLEFFRYWTCKEAYVKALGGGLSIPLNEFEVRPSADRPAVARVFIGSAAEPSSWYVHRLAVGDGWVGALAVESAHPRVRLTGETV